MWTRKRQEERLETSGSLTRLWGCLTSRDFTFYSVGSTCVSEQCWTMEKWGKISLIYYQFCCCSSATKSCLTLWNPMNRSTPGSPVLHYLQSLLKLMSIESVTPSNHLILCHPLLHPQSFPASGILSASQLFTSDSQSIGASASVFLLRTVESPSHPHLRYTLGQLGNISGTTAKLSA